MTALPSNTTAILYLDYSGCGESHTTSMRYGTGSSYSEAMTMLADLLTAIASSIKLINIDGARVRDAGANVTYPVTWTGASSYGVGIGDHNASAYYWDFVGRSIDGRRCRLAVFCAVNESDGTNHDFRITAAESTRVADCLAILESGTDLPVSISGLEVAWQQYVNIGANAYWRNHIR